MYCLFVGNRLVIYHFHERLDHFKHQLIEGIPLSYVGTCLAISFNTFAALALVTWARASVADPGSLPSKIDKVSTECKYCKASKPVRAHHCRSCNRCVFKMDSHCYWINNCVGVYNKKFYVLFIFYSLLASVMAIVLGLDATYCIMF
jgi:palmitoyltransferase